MAPIWKALFAVVGLLALIGYCQVSVPSNNSGSNTSASTSESSSPSQPNIPEPQKHIVLEAGKLYKTKAAYPIAITPEDLEKGIQLSHDKGAFAKFAAEGRINLTKPGLHVYFEDIKLSGLIKIRLEGETEGLWTVKDAIEPIANQETPEDKLEPKDIASLNRQLFEFLGNISVLADMGETEIDSNVKKLLDRGASANATNEIGETPLMICARSGLLKTVQLLIKRKANVNAQDESGETALGWAVENNEVKMVNVFLANGANVNLKNKNGRNTALYGTVSVDLNKGGVEVIEPRYREVRQLLKNAGAK